MNNVKPLQHFYTKKEARNLIGKMISKVVMEEPVKGKYTIAGFTFTDDSIIMTSTLECLNDEASVDLGSDAEGNGCLVIPKSKFIDKRSITNLDLELCPIHIVKEK